MLALPWIIIWFWGALTMTESLNWKCLWPVLAALFGSCGPCPTRPTYTSSWPCPWPAGMDLPLEAVLTYLPSGPTWLGIEETLPGKACPTTILLYALLPPMIILAFGWVPPPALGLRGCYIITLLGCMLFMMLSLRKLMLPPM